MFTATLSVRSLFFVLALADLVLLAATVAGAADPDTVTVNTEDDYIPWLPNDPKISLRSALNLANKSEEIDKIILPAGTYTLTIVGSGDDTNSAGDLDILDSVTITGAGPDKTIIDGNASDRVFDIRPSFKPEGIAVVLNNLTIQNGKVTPTMAQDSGGGIRNRENLTLNNVVVRNNNAVGNDSSNVVGGGILNGGTLTMVQCTVAGNRARRGGGLFTGNATTIKQSLIAENRAMFGSGIQAYGDLLLENTTIHFNGFDAFDGGRCALAVSGPGTAVVNFCTITDNRTYDTLQSSGLCTIVDSVNTASLTLRGTILAGNKLLGSSTTNNCYLEAALTSATYNLEDANTCGFSTATNLINTDPKLGPLQDNGGSTQTRALAAGSPAIDYVKINTGVIVDQRGFTRPVGPWADIGAYEYERDVSTFCFPIRSPDGKTAIICL